MKLSAASTYYDFNSETDILETMQVLQIYIVLISILLDHTCVEINL